MSDLGRWVQVEACYTQRIGHLGAATRFFGEFRKRSPEFIIERLGHWEPLTEKFSESTAVESWTTSSAHSKDVAYCHLILYGTKPVPFYAFVHWYGEGSHPSFTDAVSIQVSDPYASSQGNMAKLLDMFKFLLSFADPYYGRVAHSDELSEKNWRTRLLPDGRRSKESISLKPAEGLVDLYWANYFGLPYLRSFKRQPLELSQHRNVETLGNGVIVFLSQPPFETLAQDSGLYASLRKMIGEEHFFDKMTGAKPQSSPLFD